MRSVIKHNTYSPPVYAPPPPSNSTLFFAKNIVIIVVVIIIMLLICGVLHFVMRYLMNKIRLCSNSHHHHESSTRFQENSEGDVAVYQRQLQQLFTLHDSGLDQSSIDALPVFVYKELVGFKKEHHQHHCAVCLCEFTQDDTLRLLPVCSHAFHTHCIDTWLLSNSTCPLCRGSLFTPGFSVVNPVFDFDFDLDLDFSREEEEDDDDDHGLGNNSDTHDDGHSGNLKQCERGVYPVKLGKFRAINVDKQEVGQTSSNGNLDERRCYSMGSYEYVVANSDLQVAFFQDKARIGNSSSDLRIEKDKVVKENYYYYTSSSKISSNGSKGESFSVSKIWLWSKKDNQDSSMPMWSKNPLSM